MKFDKLLKLYESKHSYSRTNDTGTFYFSSDENPHMHREVGPAFIGKDGTKSWFIDGKRHRDDGPAIEYKDGSTMWYKHGHLHRIGGPAVEDSRQGNQWWEDGKLHRLDGPALDDKTGQWYYINGVRHREDGPAVIRHDTPNVAGYEEWWMNDKKLSPEEVAQQKKKIAIKNAIQSHKNNRIDPGMLEDYL